MTPKFDYTVIEDDGGNLHLFLFAPDHDNPALGFVDFEWTPGSLIEALDALDNGDDASTWGGRIENVQEQWDYINSHEYGYQVIAYRQVGDAERTIKPERMGRAGQIEFGIEAA